VKEDLLDDIIKESSPYKPPEKVMKRSDLASDFAKPKMYKPNE
jgi:import inner membrane translocase subunit TIM44